jgi:hypothetical protein
LHAFVATECIWGISKFLCAVRSAKRLFRFRYQSLYRPLDNFLDDLPEHFVARRFFTPVTSLAIRSAPESISRLFSQCDVDLLDVKMPRRRNGFNWLE